MTDSRCAHETCNCAARPEHDGYCSQYCGTVERSEPRAGACACGHDSCHPADETGHREKAQVAVGPRG